MDRQDRMANGNIREHLISQHNGHDHRPQTMFPDPSRGNEGRSIVDRPNNIVIGPLTRAHSIRFRIHESSDVPLSQIQNVHVHLLGCFKDLRLNLKTFPSLQTLVVHILPDPVIQNTDFRTMSDHQVYDFATAYLFSHLRNRNFRDNLLRLHQNEGRPNNFSLKAHIKGTDHLTFIIVDLDTREVERGIRCLPTTFFQSPREQSLRDAQVPRIQIPEPCHPSHSDDAWQEITLNWNRSGYSNLAGQPATWYGPEYIDLWKHFQQQQQLEASGHR
jgi:hypothetical protein